MFQLVPGPTTNVRTNKQIKCYWSKHTHTRHTQKQTILKVCVDKATKSI